MAWKKTELITRQHSKHERFDGWHSCLALAIATCFAFGLASCADTEPTTPTGTKITIKGVTASNTLAPEQAPSKVIDGDTTTQWGAGQHPPQWIQLDLGQETSIAKVRLCTSQTPEGATTHEIYGGVSPAQLKLIGTAADTTHDNQWIEVSMPANQTRYVKILTVHSPSWVGWREIEVYQ